MRFAALVAVTLLSTFAQAEGAGATPKTKFILEGPMTAEEFAQAKEQLGAMLKATGGDLANLSLSLGEEPTWPEPPSYDLSATPFSDLGHAPPLPPSAVPMRVERSRFKPGTLELTVDRGGLPNRLFSRLSLAAVEVRVGKKTYPPRDVQVSDGPPSFDGLTQVFELQVPELPKTAEGVRVKASLRISLPETVRTYDLAWGAEPPALAGFQWLATAAPKTITYQLDRARYAAGLAVLALGPNGKQLARGGSSEQEVGATEFLKKLFIDSTFESLPERVEKPTFAQRRVTETFQSTPAELRIAVAGPLKTQTLVVEASTGAAAPFHLHDLPSMRACPPSELGQVVVFAHRSVALASFGSPELSVLTPDCVNFSMAAFTLEGATFTDAAGQALPREALTVGVNGYTADKLAYTWSFEGAGAARLGVATGTVQVKVDEVEPVVFDHHVVRRDPKTQRWQIVLRMPPGVEGDHLWLLDASGAALDLPSRAISTTGDQLTLTTDATLAGVDKVVLYRHEASQTVRVPFRVDFATVPGPRRASAAEGEASSVP